MNLLATDAAAPPQRMRFSGTEGDLFRILLGGSLLQIPTFGFYRFWLVTDVRRHIWSHTMIGDDVFEYSGRGRELLIGFLVAMAVLVPIYLAYFLLALEAERLQAFASTPMVALLYVLGYYAIYRARRYRASRTIFRGIRFSMSGSAWAYLARAIPWDLATILTLGFLYPWRVAALEGYKMRHTHYGSLAGGFAARGSTLFRRGAWIWATYLAGLTLIAAFSANEDWLSTIVLGVALVVATPFLFPIFRAIELRWWLEGIRFGQIEAASDLRIKTVLGCYMRLVAAWMAYGAVGGTVIALAAAVVLGIGALIFGPIEELTEAPNLPVLIAGGAAGVLAYVAFLLGFDIIRRIVLDRGIWAAATDSVALTGLDALDAVVAAQREQPGGVGEGLLDALDMGGGF